MDHELAGAEVVELRGDSLSVGAGVVEGGGNWNAGDSTGRVMTELRPAG